MSFFKCVLVHLQADLQYSLPVSNAVLLSLSNSCFIEFSVEYEEMLDKSLFMSSNSSSHDFNLKFNFDFKVAFSQRSSLEVSTLQTNITQTTKPTLQRQTHEFW